MELKYVDDRHEAFMGLINFSCGDPALIQKVNDQYKILWIRNGDMSLTIDGERLQLGQNDLVFLTPHQQIHTETTNPEAVLFSFNREFYCIQDHDEEVSCHGLLFYGTAGIPKIQLQAEDSLSLDRLYAVFIEEFEEKDHIQGEMLRMLLKRLIIKSTRLVRNSLPQPDLTQSKVDLIRQFNVLVEKHFREKHFVADYADMLYKSPKTISNVFASYHHQTPLQVISERIVLEAKRLLIQTNLTGKEISHILGYQTADHFSKFFKKHTGNSPKDYRESIKLKEGKN